MADDVTLPGTGAVVATDDIGGGRQAQLMKLLDGTDGSAQSARVNSDGQLAVSVEALTAAFIKAMSNVLDGMALDPVTGRLRVSIDAIASALTLATITTVSTVTTCSTVTNKAQEGGVPSNSMIYDLMDNNWVDNVRRQIT